MTLSSGLLLLMFGIPITVLVFYLIFKAEEKFTDNKDKD